jgi:hypothetical protein
MTDSAKEPEVTNEAYSLWDRARELDKVFAWSFAGFLLAIIFGAITIYLGFIQERKPNLKLDVISNTSVLDIHERLGKLAILYGGNNIKENGQSLRVITIRVINDGQQDILKGHYDESDPLGFTVLDGTIIETPELLYASNDYLERNIRIISEIEPGKTTLNSSAKVSFSNLIIEQGEFFVLKVLVLHGEQQSPDIKPGGKIAGVKTIQVVRSYKEAATESFWKRTFYGGALTQILRTAAYGILFLILGVVTLNIAVKYSDWADKMKRKKLVKNFKRTSDAPLEGEEEKLFQAYIDQGENLLFHIESYLLSSFGPQGGALYRAVYPHLEKRLIKLGLIQKTEKGNALNDRMNRTFEEFMKFLRANGKFEMLDASPQMTTHISPP